MNKITAIIMSTVICALSVIPIIAGASNKYYTKSMIFEKDDTLKEALSFEIGDIYKSVEMNEEGKYRFVYTSYTANVKEEFCSTAYITLGYYVNLSVEEADMLTNYINNAHPEFTAETTESTEFNNAYDVTIDYGKELTFEEEVEYALEIKTGTGLTCEIILIEDLHIIQIIGDLNADNTITASDAAMALSYYASGQTALAVASNEETVNYSLIADYNNDGMVTAVDAALILSDYAKGQVS